VVERGGREFEMGKVGEGERKREIRERERKGKREREERDFIIRILNLTASDKNWNFEIN
jgi:hypothetical protein